MSVAALFFIIVLILFVLAAIGVGARFNLTAAGLASLTVAFLLGAGVL